MFHTLLHTLQHLMATASMKYRHSAALIMCGR